MNANEVTTVRHKVGTCPACKCGLWGEVNLIVDLGTPWLDDDGTARVFASARADVMRLTHNCTPPDSAAPDADIDDALAALARNPNAHAAGTRHDRTPPPTPTDDAAQAGTGGRA